MINATSGVSRPPSPSVPESNSAPADSQPKLTPGPSSPGDVSGTLGDLPRRNSVTNQTNLSRASSIRLQNAQQQARAATPEKTEIATKGPGEFLSIDDVLDPSTLEGKVLGRDYILLSHTPHSDAVGKIQESGLKSLRRLASEPDCPEFTAQKLNIAKRLETYNKFAPDASLLYFRPIVRNPQFPIKETDIVIAVRPEAANVLNQEHRVKEYGNPDKYKFSSMNVMQYEALREKIPEGHFITQYNDIQPWSAKDRGVEMYYPEVCMQADYIDNSRFVPHSSIENSLKKNGY